MILMLWITCFSKLCIIEDCEYKSLYDVHNHFQYNLRLTDKQVAEMLETILCLKVFAVNSGKQF